MKVELNAWLGITSKGNKYLLISMEYLMQFTDH